MFRAAFWFWLAVAALIELAALYVWVL